MITISKSYSFDSAHQLYVDENGPHWNEEEFGKCSRVHGHTYTLKVFITGQVIEENGMIMNFFDIDAFMKPIIEMLDHKFLNGLAIFSGMLTTSENMVQKIAKQIQYEVEMRGRRLLQVELSETPRTKAIWTP